MTVGMVSSWMNAVLDAARARGLTVRDLVLVQDNRYTMEGSALNGTMTGGALPVELDVRIDADADEDAVREMVAAAVRGATVYDVLRRPHVSRFTLAVNGAEAQVDRAARLDGARPSDPAAAFSAGRAGRPRRGAGRASRGGEAGGRRGRRRRHEPAGRAAPAAPPAGGLPPASRRREGDRAAAPQPPGVDVPVPVGRAAGAGRQRRRALRRRLHGGRRRLLLHDPARALRGHSREGPARVPHRAGHALSGPRRFRRGAVERRRRACRPRCGAGGRCATGEAMSPRGGASLSGAAGAVETHVYLDTREGVDFARRCLDMGEQTCFLHALYRTPLEPVVTTTRDVTCREAGGATGASRPAPRAVVRSMSAESPKDSGDWAHDRDDAIGNGDGVDTGPTGTGQRRFELLHRAVPERWCRCAGARGNGDAARPVRPPDRPRRGADVPLRDGDRARRVRGGADVRARVAGRDCR